MSKMQRTKGAVNEREVAEMYAFVLDKEVKRELKQYQEKLGRDLRGCQPYCVQVKSGKKVNYRDGLKDAFSAIGNGYAYPVVHIHENNKEGVVVLDEKFWLVCVELLKDKLK